MSEQWDELEVRQLSSSERSSFTDGDWVEAPHIRDEGIRLIQTGNIGVGQFVDRSKKYISQQSFNDLRCTEVFPGDLLICRLAEPIGRACFAPQLGERMITSVDVTILKVDKATVDPSFVVFSINTPNFLHKCEVVSGGTTRQRISRSNLGTLRIRRPSLRQQQRIAEILSTVDEAIEQTEALIAKTQQIKAGLMHDLFTRGVTPGGQLRPPREEAPHLYKESPLGWIPKEWEFALLDEVRDARHPITYGVLKPGPYVQNGIPLLQIEDVIHGELDFSKIHRISAQLDSEYSRTRVSGGEIIISLVGTIGRVAHLPVSMERSNLHRNLGFIAIAEDAIPRYFFFFLQTHVCASLIAQTTLGSTQSLLNLGSLRCLPVPLPGIPERCRIANAIDMMAEGIASETARLGKLSQLRAALMHDLLTGRVRVKVAEGANT